MPTDYSHPRNRTVTLDTSVAPAQRFFCRRIALPQDLSREELDSFIQLELEGQSPFPIEHLHFGYALDADAQHAFFYAAYRRSFESSEMGKWSAAEHVLPDFAIGVVACAPGSPPLLIISEQSCAYFEYDAASSLPCRFLGFPRLHPDSVEEEAEARRQQLAEEQRPVGLRIWQAHPDLVWQDQAILIKASEPSVGLEYATALTKPMLWRMDLRDAETIASVKGKEHRDRVLWNVTLGMAAAAALLLVGEVLLGAGYSYLALRQGWNRSQAPLVAEIEAKSSTVNELLAFEESDHGALAMLLELEPFRPASVIFSRVDSDGPNGLRIDAIAPTIADANAFRSRMETFEKLESIELINMQNRPGGATFTAVVRFLPGTIEALDVETEVATNG